MHWLKTNWRQVRSGLLIGFAFVGVFFIAATIYSVFAESREPSFEELLQETHKSDVGASTTPSEISDSSEPPTRDGSLYFISGNESAGSCPIKSINWDIAVAALTDYADTHPDADFGPAEIQRHFSEDCAADTKIYNAFVDDQISYLRAHKL